MTFTGQHLSGVALSLLYILGVMIVLTIILPFFTNSRRLKIILSSGTPRGDVKRIFLLLAISAGLYWIYDALELGQDILIFSMTMISIIFVILRSLILRSQSYNFTNKLQVTDLAREIQILIFDLGNDKQVNPKEAIRSILIKYNFNELALDALYSDLVGYYKTPIYDKGQFLISLRNSLTINILMDHPELRVVDFNPELQG